MSPALLHRNTERGKSLDLLKQVAPRLARVAVTSDPANTAGSNHAVDKGPGLGSIRRRFGYP
jgi:hypothetical protein